MHDLFPTTDDAVRAARLYLTDKVRDEAHVAAFTAGLEKIRVPEAERERLVAAWQQRMNNIGKMSLAQAEFEGKKLSEYAAGHAKRAKQFIAAWLAQSLGASRDGDERIRVLADILERELGR